MTLRIVIVQLTYDLPDEVHPYLVSRPIAPNVRALTVNDVSESASIHNRCYDVYNELQLPYPPLTDLDKQMVTEALDTHDVR